jgi:hypothetical protein
MYGGAAAAGRSENEPAPPWPLGLLARPFDGYVELTQGGAQMPFTLFCHQGSPEQALAFLVERAARVEGGSSCWEASFTSGGGFLRRKASITFTYDRDWCSPPNWPTQLAGMANYVRSLKMTDVTRRLVFALIPRFAFSIGVLTEPEITKGDDVRLEIMQDLAAHLACVVFTPGALRDARLRAFASADGELDPDAQIPRGQAESPEPPSDTVAADPEPPTPERVARRLYALVAVVARGLFEMNSKGGREPAYSLHALRRWVDRLGIDGELEPAEQRLLATMAGDLKPQELIDSVWICEGAAVLAWALRLAPALPRYDEQVDVDALLQAVAFLDGERCLAAVHQPVLRSAEELARLEAQMLAYHWRMVDFRVRPEGTRFDDVTIFGGPFDLSWADLREGDLALHGRPIAAADREVVKLCSSISLERFRAATWLQGHASVYSETRTDT